MNLVAKEFVASRDGGGAVILSRFAGASQELQDALIVNPYDTDQLAAAIRMGLEMKKASVASSLVRFIAAQERVGLCGFLLRAAGKQQDIRQTFTN